MGIAATGRRGIEIAVRHADLWITQDVAQDPRVAAPTAEAEIERQLAIVDEVCAEQGRDPATLERLAVLGYGSERPLDSVAAFQDAIERYTARGISRIAVLWPRGDRAAKQLAILEGALAEKAG